jgi:hypothetical protein
MVYRRPKKAKQSRKKPGKNADPHPLPQNPGFLEANFNSSTKESIV